MIRKLLLAVTAAFLPGVAQAAWQQASSAHFVVYSDDTPDRIRAFTVRLERFDKAMHIMRDVPDKPVSPSNRVTVFVLRDEDAVRAAYGHRDANVAGFYVPRAGGSVAFVPRDEHEREAEALSGQAVLLHEYAHHWMFSNWGDIALPGWFVEGFAEFNATARFGDDGSVVIGAAPQYRANGMLNDALVPARMLLTASPNSLHFADQAQVFYARAWLLTHYLTFDAKRREQLRAYIAAINDGRTLTDAAATLGDMATLDARLDSYASAGRPRATLAASQLPIGPVEVRALSLAEAVMIPVRIGSARGVDTRTAQPLAAQARTLAAAFPGDAAAQNALAEAEYDAGQFAASDAAATRALVTDATSVHALIYRGMARMALAHQAKADDPAVWQEARRWFARANRAEPDDPLPLKLYYESFGVQGIAPTANARDGLLRAHELAPFDQSLGLMAADIYLDQGKVDRARTTLKPIAYNPHSEGTAAVAVKALAALDKDGVAGARAALAEKKPSAPKGA